MRRRRDAGMSLVELSVAMTVTMLIVVLAMGVYVTLTRDYRKAVGQVTSSADAQLTRETIDRSLRAADAVPPVVSDVANIIETGQGGEITFYTGFRDATAANAQATTVDGLNPGNVWAVQLRSSELVPRKVRYALQTSAPACGGRDGIVQQVWPVASTSYSSATGDFTVTWGTTATSRCLMRTSTPPAFAYYADCAGTTPVAAPLTTATRDSVQAVELRITPSAKTQIVDRVCLVNSGTGASG